jgi:flagellar assembly protein FliH
MATIIKASGPVRFKDGASFNFDDMSVKANSYLEKVRQEAVEIVAQAKKEGDAIRKRAEEEGRKAAIDAASKVMDEKVGKQLVTLLPAIRQVAEQLDQLKHSWLAHWERAAIHTAAQIASRVVRQEISQQPQISVNLLKEALELAAGSPTILVRMNPEDVATLGTHAEALAQELGRQAVTQVLADASITRGGCRVETKFGIVDQQIESQIKRIEEELGA